ncbi:MAG: hypothetical protein ACK45Y_03970 [Betaproteobacteria bacterium]
MLGFAIHRNPQVEDYRRPHIYHTLGRPRLTSQTLTDGTYTSFTAYDTFGRVITNQSI